MELTSFLSQKQGTHSIKKEVPRQHGVQIEWEFLDVFLFLFSEEAVVTGDIGEAIKGVGAAGASGHIWSAAY